MILLGILIITSLNYFDSLGISLYDKALEKLEKKDTSEAVYYLKYFVEKLPHHSVALPSLSLLVEISKKYPPLEEELGKILDKGIKNFPQPQREYVFKYKINYLIEKRNYPELIKTLKDFLNFTVDSSLKTDLLKMLVLSFIHLASYDSAEYYAVKIPGITEFPGIVAFLKEDYSKASYLLRDFHDPTSYFLKGVSYFYLDSLQKAEDNLKKVSKNSPVSPWSENFLALIEYKKGNFSKSLDLLENVQESTLLNFRNYYKTLNLFRLARLSEAKLTLEEIKKTKDLKEFEPHHGDILNLSYLILAQILEEEGKIQEADKVYESLEDIPEEYKVKIVDFYLKRGEDAKALMLLEKLKPHYYRFPDSIKIYFDLLEIQTNLSLGNLRKARRLINLMEEKDIPLRITPYLTYQKGILHYLERNDSLAILNLRKTLNHPVLSPYAMLYLADIYFNRRNYDKSGELYEQVLRQRNVKEDIKSEALLGLSLTHYRLKDYQTSANYLKDFINKYPDHPYSSNALYLLAVIYDEAKDFRNAELTLKELAERGPVKLREMALFDLANLYYNNGYFTEAIQTYTQLILRYPRGKSVEDALEGIFWSLNQLNKTHEIDSIIENLKTSLPELKDHFTVKEGAFWFNIGEDSVVVKKLKPQIERIKDGHLRITAISLLGEALFRLENYQEALEYYQLLKGTEHADLRLAQILLELNRYKESLNQLNLFIQNYPKSKYLQEALFLKAQNQMLLNDTTGAIKTFQATSQIDPSSRFSHLSYLYLAEIFWSKKDKKALSYLDSIIQFRTDDIAAKAYLKKGYILRDIGKEEEAATIFIQTSNLFLIFPDIVQEALLEAAKTYEKMGKLKEALVLYKRYARKFPDAPMTNEVNKKIKELESKIIKAS